MRFLIVDAYYPEFLRAFYKARPERAALPYEAQRAALLNECFGTADFYSTNLQRLGHEATELIANCRPLQLQWAKEHGLGLRYQLQTRTVRGVRVPWVDTDWPSAVLLAQVQAHRPDVIHFQEPVGTSGAVVRALRPFVRLITGQIASPLPPHVDLSGYDLMLSSLPHFVERFRQQGLRAEYFKLGFEPKVLQRLQRKPGPATVFVGGLSLRHAERIKFLGEVARSQPIEWWGYGSENLPAGSPLRASYRGSAWALAMYEQLYNARIVLNHHIDVADGYANNMRLFEATGVGALLITDWKANLHDLFEPGREVAVYRTAAECAEQIAHYLVHDEERATIARAGQERTLREHTYYNRMQEFAGIVDRHV